MSMATFHGALRSVATEFAITRADHAWDDPDDPAVFLVAASSSRWLADAPVYQQRVPYPPALAARRIGIFRDVFGESIAAVVAGWEYLDGADLLSAIYPMHLVSLNWFFASYRWGLDCYSLFYPRAGPGAEYEYHHYYFPDIHHPREWYRARSYEFVRRITRPDWALEEWGPAVFS